jgi:hypothetical protein
MAFYAAFGPCDNRLLAVRIAFDVKNIHGADGFASFASFAFHQVDFWRHRITPVVVFQFI